MMRRDVDSLLLVLHDDELLRSGLPLDRVDAVYQIDALMTTAADGSTALPPARVKALMDLLHDWAAG